MVAKKKSRGIAKRTSIQQKKKKRVVSSHPLAKLPPSHPDYDYIEVIEDDELDDEESVDLEDFEMMSTFEINPDSDSDLITLSSYNDDGSLATLNTPENIVLITDANQIAYSSGADGTYVASMFISFDEVSRATDYEVRITE